MVDAIFQVIRFAKVLASPSSNRIWITNCTKNFFDSGGNNRLRTRWSLSLVVTWFKSYINDCARWNTLCRIYRNYFSMVCALMKTFADEFASCASNNCANNWVWGSLTKASASTLDGARHRSICT